MKFSLIYFFPEYEVVYLFVWFFSCSVHRQKKRPPCNPVYISALRLPTLSRNQAGDWRRAKLGNRNAPRGVFSVYGRTMERSVSIGEEYATFFGEWILLGISKHLKLFNSNSSFR